MEKKKGVKTLNLPQNLQPTMKQSKSVVTIRRECFVGNHPDNTENIKPIQVSHKPWVPDFLLFWIGGEANNKRPNDLDT